MDNFRDLVEADIGSLLATAGQAVTDKITAKGKEIGNRFLAGLGSSRGAGRLDHGQVYDDLVSNWKYYLTTQRQKPTVATFVDFIQTVFGVALPQASIYTAIYGYDPLKSPKPPEDNGSK